MLTPQTAEWLAGRATPFRDRDAQQLADLRAALSKVRRTPVERLQALFAREQPPTSANCDCTE